MRIFIMGEVGVGKSHAVEYLAKKGYDVVRDPVIALGEEFLGGADSLKIQLGVASQLYLAAVTREDGVFDSCLPQSLQFVRANYSLGFIQDDAYRSIHGAYINMIGALGKNDVYIYLNKPSEQIKAQIVQRGRPYEQDNPFIAEANNFIRNSLVDFTRGHKLKTHVCDVTENYDELEQLIDEILGGKI